jgi:sugar phosphate isomerase/epimerase
MSKQSLGPFPLFFDEARVMSPDLARVFPSATRRRFLNVTGGVLASLAFSPKARAMGVAEAQISHSKSPIPFHLGLASYSLRNFDLDRALAMTHRVGLERICLKSMHLPLDSGPSQIAAATEKVKHAGLLLYGGGVINMKNERDIAQAFEYAKAAGMQTITAAPAPDVLRALDEHVKRYDITVAIHNHGPGDRYFPTPQSVYDAIKSLDHRIGLCIDIGHTVRIGADLLSSVRNCGDRLFDLHIKDVTEASPQGKGTPLGRGIIDIPGLVRALIDVKFKGVASFEYEEQPDDPLPGLAESVGFMKGVLATI